MSKREHAIERELLVSVPRRVRYTASANRTWAITYLACVLILGLTTFTMARALRSWEALRRYGVSTQAKVVEVKEIALRDEANCNIIYEFRVGTLIVAGSERFLGACSQSQFSRQIDVTYLPENPHIFCERDLAKQSPYLREACCALCFLAVLAVCAAIVAWVAAGFRSSYRLLQEGDVVVARVKNRLLRVRGTSSGTLIYEFPIDDERTQRASIRVSMRYVRLCGEGQQITVLMDRNVPERSLPYFLLRRSVSIARKDNES